MTQQHEKMLMKISNQINEIRAELDVVMYNVQPHLSESEHKKVREAYDLICQANDKLF